MTTRRRFLSASTGVLCMPGTLRWATNSARAADTEVAKDGVQLSPDIEPLVRLIEETPREGCFDRVAAELGRGLPYRQLVAALFLAGIRNVNPQPPGFKFHCVFVIHAAHQLSLDAPVNDRLLPLFWALDNFKSSQEKDVAEGDFRLGPVRGRLPTPSAAWDEFHTAMEQWDEGKADRSIAALARHSGGHRLVDQLWIYGARDYRNIGHKAIFVANTWRTLQTIGWRHAEPALRSLVLGLLDFGPDQSVNGYAFDDQCFPANVARVEKHRPQLRGDWIQSTGNQSSTELQLDAIRTGNMEDACQLAVNELVSGKSGAPELWDAAHLAAGELMMQQPGIFGIHTVTSVNALHYAYENAGTQDIRLLMLLQGIGWMCQFHNFMKGTRQGLKETRITDLMPSEKAANLSEIFASIGSEPGKAAPQAMAFARLEPDADSFMRTANRLLLRKATDAHDYKYAASIFEDYRRVSRPWQPHMLATATYYLHGSSDPDSPVIRRAVEAVSRI